MSDPIRALLIDMDGVLYQGEEVIPGSRETLDWLNAEGVPHLFVTNTTSRPRRALIEKLSRSGLKVETEQIWTPPTAAARWLGEQVSGPIALYVPPATAEDFAGLDLAEPASSQPVAAVVVGDYGAQWTFDGLNGAFRQLMDASQPLLVALGMTRYWQAEDGLRLDTGPFVAALEYASGRKATILGKPAPAFFDAALGQLGVNPAEAVMVGDDIRSDVGGAQDAGIRGLLVQTGKFRPEDLDGEIRPAGVLGTIAELPDWWAAQG